VIAEAEAVVKVEEEVASAERCRILEWGAILSARTKSKQNKAQWEREDIAAHHKELAKQEALVQELDDKIRELFEKVKQHEIASFERVAVVEKDVAMVS
jgi:uncharacterized protein (DUF3084 family)